MVGIVEEWGGDEVDLRAAENQDTVEAEVVDQGTAVGTVSLDALTFTADEPLEILAIRYRARMSCVLTVGGTASQASRRRRGKAFNVTTLETFGEGRAGDYFTEEVICAPSNSVENAGDSLGAGFDGIDDVYVTLVDPGLDSFGGPLVLREGEEVSVHLEQRAHNAPGAPNDQVLRHRLDVWWEAVPEAETEVRRRGDFPSQTEPI